ncbi:MAG TPA: MmcQ/YjbR family DNA-binding protein [Candidatus Acetothermia bacterium]|nr:MmcQ/YjbR family DNA-binding protein [Candidatus Acetothermia bacterium]
MNLDSVRTHLMAKVGATEERPFDLETPVYKVMGKMFALLAPEQSPLRITLKCDPDHALMLRDTYASVIPGYHMNKRHWSTIILDGTIADTSITDTSIADDEIEEMIDESYDLVVKGLTKAARRELEEAYTD